MKILDTKEITTNFGPTLDVKAAIANNGAGAAAVLRKSAKDAGHPPTIGQLPGCGTIILRRDGESFLKSISGDWGCAPFLVPISRTDDGLYAVGNTDDCDYVWAPDEDARDTIRRIVLDQLRAKYNASADFDVDFNSEAGGFFFVIEGGARSDRIYPSHNLAYIAASEEILSGSGVHLSASYSGPEIKELMDLALDAYAKEVIREYNDWLMGETYEVARFEFKSDAPDAAPTQVGSSLVIVGRDNANHLLDLIFGDITAGIQSREDKDFAPDDTRTSCAPSP